MDVRARSFPPGADFLNQSFSSSQFGNNDEDAWTDDDEDADNDSGIEPECRHQ